MVNVNEVISLAKIKVPTKEDFSGINRERFELVEAVCNKAGIVGDVFVAVKLRHRAFQTDFATLAMKEHLSNE